MGLVASRPLAAGGVALRERPLVLVCVGRGRALACARCARQGAWRTRCRGGCGERYCSDACMAAQGHGGDREALCAQLAAAEGWARGSKRLAARSSGALDAALDAVRWALHALWLRESAPDDWQALRGLEPREGEHAVREQDAEALLAEHTGLAEGTAVGTLVAALEAAHAAATAAQTTQHAPPLRRQALLRLLLKDALNSTCLTVDHAALGHAVGAGVVREPALVATYATLCLANHDCAPTCARLDVGFLPFGEAELRTLHDVPAGAPVTMSYLPLGGADRAERRSRLRASHGFECACERCQCEAAEEAAGGAMAHEHSAYFAVFMLRHACPRCGGTLCPWPPADADGEDETVYVCCNWPCTFRHTEKQFLAMLR